MDNGTRTRMQEIVHRIEAEQDQTKFTALIDELNRLLDDDTPGNSNPNKRSDQL
jgi:hypothetical protein